MHDDLRDGPRIWFPPPFVYLGLAAVAWWLDGHWQLRPPASLGGVLDVVGLLFVVAGASLDLSSLALFWLERTSALPFRPASKFVARGAYRFSRNPMYLGMTLLVAGLGLLVERLGLVAAALAASLIIDRAVIAREERHLETVFGDSYRDYRRRVRRWL